MTWVTWIWDKIAAFVPVERWVAAVRNVLNALGLAFVLLWILVFILLIHHWGFSQYVRLGLIISILALLLLVVLIVVVLALKQGDPLYSPYDRSLGRGKHYGTKVKPRRRSKVLKLPQQPLLPGLPPPPNPPKKKKKPRQPK